MPALRNGVCLREALRRAYIETESTAEGRVPADPELATMQDARALDPRPYLPRIRCRVDLVHGADDEVIPFEQSHALAAGLVHADVRTHITGIYGHTGASRPTLRASVREMLTMLRILRALA